MIKFCCKKKKEKKSLRLGKALFLIILIWFGFMIMENVEGSNPSHSYCSIQANNEFYGDYICIEGDGQIITNTNISFFNESTIINTYDNDTFNNITNYLNETGINYTVENGSIILGNQTIWYNWTIDNSSFFLNQSGAILNSTVINSTLENINDINNTVLIDTDLNNTNKINNSNINNCSLNNTNKLNNTQAQNSFLNNTIDITMSNLTDSFLNNTNWINTTTIINTSVNNTLNLTSTTDINNTNINNNDYINIINITIDFPEPEKKFVSDYIISIIEYKIEGRELSLYLYILVPTNDYISMFLVDGDYFTISNIMLNKSGNYWFNGTIQKDKEGLYVLFLKDSKGNIHLTIGINIPLIKTSLLGSLTDSDLSFMSYANTLKIKFLRVDKFYLIWGSLFFFGILLFLYAKWNLAWKIEKEIASKTELKKMYHFETPLN